MVNCNEGVGVRIVTKSLFVLLNVCVNMFATSFALEEGAVREPVGGGKTV